MNVPRTNYNKKCWLPMALIQDAIKNNYLDSLCYLAWLKTKFKRKPIFYNYSIRKVAKALNCSPTTLSYHLKILRSKGLIYDHNKNLCIIGNHKSRRLFKSFMVPVGVSENKQEQIAYLRFVAIKKNLYSQSKAYYLAGEILKFRKGLIFDYASVKKLRALEKKYPSSPILESRRQQCLTLSNNKFGALCNRSQSTGLKIQKAFNELFLLISKKRIQLISDNIFNRKGFFSLQLDSSYFLSNTGYAFKRLPNELVLFGCE